MLTPPLRERGAALLAVLLLVAVIGAIAVVAIDRLRFSTALAANGAGLDRARAQAIGIETLAALRIDDLAGRDAARTTLAGGWNGAMRQIVMPDGAVARVTVRDGGNCFNVNSVADGSLPTALAPRQTGIDQLAALMVVLGVPAPSAAAVAAAAGDWADADTAPGRSGAEDALYLRAERPYRSGNTYFADVSELRAVQGMTPEIYALLRPWLCALPTTDLSPINVNTLTLDQAPLLAMLAPDRIGLAAARAAIEARPAQGWRDLVDFYRLPMLADIELPFEVRVQPRVRTSWFALDVRIDGPTARIEEKALVDARIAPARIIQRDWGGEQQ